MCPSNYWRLAEELNVIQAALLIVEIEPAEMQSDVERWVDEKKPPGYSAVSTALKNAIKAERLPAKIEMIHEMDGIQYIDWSSTTFRVEDLKNWLKERNFSTGFFFQDNKTTGNFLDPQNEYYAPKLSAAVNAWSAVTDDSTLLDGKSPKQALDKWLRENASHYGLTKDDGNPNESAIEEISKIANWNPVGGAVKTPTKVQENLPPTKRKSPRVKPESTLPL